MITYDPRGMERSTLTPAGEVAAEIHAEDCHRVVEAAGSAVDAFGSSGGGSAACSGWSSTPTTCAPSSPTSHR